MEDRTVNYEAINKIYQNAHVALQSISNVSPEVEDADLKKEILEEYEGYEKLIGEISTFMKDNGFEPKDISGMKKLMLWSGVKMNTVMDDSKSRIAQIMVKGTVTGITDLYSLISEGKQTLDKSVLNYADKLKTLEEEYEERLKKYL